MKSFYKISSSIHTRGGFFCMAFFRPFPAARQDSGNPALLGGIKSYITSDTRPSNIYSFLLS